MRVFFMNTFVFCCLFFFLIRMGLCVQLVCACTSNIIMYFQFYFRLFSVNDGLDFLRNRPNGVGCDTGIADSDDLV